MAANENYVDAVDVANEVNREKHRWEWEREQIENDFDCERIEAYKEEEEAREFWDSVPEVPDEDDHMDGYTDPWQ